MAIIVTCACGQSFETSDANAGRRAKCPMCARELIVPSPGQPGSPDDLVHFEPLARYTSGKAIGALVLGLLSPFLCVFAGLPAIILGALGLSDISQSKGRVRGKGMAITGIVLGALGCTLLPIALLLPAVQSAREAARRAQCVNNLKQIGLAMHNYHSANNCFPPQAITDEDGKPLLSWRVLLLPYLEQAPLYSQFHLNEPWDSPNNKPLLAMMPALFRCPSDPTPLQAGLTSYEGVVGPRTMFPGGRHAPVGIADVTDGTSNTLFVGETRTPVPWTAPSDNPLNLSLPQAGFGSLHPGGFNTLFVDGSVRFIKLSINPVLLQGLLTRNGGEVISADSY